MAFLQGTRKRYETKFNFSKVKDEKEAKQALKYWVQYLNKEKKRNVSLHKKKEYKEVQYISALFKVNNCKTVCIEKTASLQAVCDDMSKAFSDFGKAYRRNFNGKNCKVLRHCNEANEDQDTAWYQNIDACKKAFETATAECNTADSALNDANMVLFNAQTAFNTAFIRATKQDREVFRLQGEVVKAKKDVEIAESELIFFFITTSLAINLKDASNILFIVENQKDWGNSLDALFDKTAVIQTRKVVRQENENEALRILEDIKIRHPYVVAKARAALEPY